MCCVGLVCYAWFWVVGLMVAIWLFLARSGWFNAAWFWLLGGVLAYRFVWVGLLGLLLVFGLGAVF